jgi:hypothetical protein
VGKKKNFDQRYNRMKEYHCTDEPTVEYYDGSKAWHLNGELHRTDGPAFKYANGDEYWYLNGKLHRTDGPAVDAYGYKEYWVHGLRYPHLPTAEEILTRDIIE